MIAVILAAGKGKRLQSEEYDLPKVLRKVNQKPMLDYVIDNLAFAEDLILVVGYQAQKIIDHTNQKYQYAFQKQQLGTGHAVMATKDLLKNHQGDTLITFGDMPLFKKTTYRSIEMVHKKECADCTLLSCIFPNHLSIPHYGRILRSYEGEFVDIKEHKDCSEKQKEIRELNVGVMICDNQKLLECLDLLDCENAQKEYYLTDIPKIMKDKGYKVVVHSISDDEEIYGANTLADLERVEAIIKKREEG